MNINLLPADTYIVINKTILNDNDRMILFSLYQPIIGSVAISLYFTLWSYLDKREIVSIEWTHHHLMASMRLSMEKIIEVREKLEAIGLLKTYIKEDKINNYIYELYSPVTPFDFFSNPILNTTLYNNIGKIEYERTIAYFQIPNINLSDYKNITLAFNQVFESISDEPIEILSEDIKRNSYRSLELISNINVDEIISKIPEEIFNHRSVNKEVKELLYKLSFIYNLKEEVFVEIIKNSIDELRKINIQELKINCQNYYKFENNGKLPTLAYKNQPEFLRKKITDTSKRSKMIYTFETTSPHDFLLNKSSSNSLTKGDKEILSYLLIELNLKPGVVNVLIDYVLRINNNKLIKSFVETIAMQWKRNKIETVDDAMNLAENEYRKRQKNYKNIKSTKKVVEEVPSWLNQTVDEKTVDENRKKEIEEMLKQYK